MSSWNVKNINSRLAARICAAILFWGLPFWLFSQMDSISPELKKIDYLPASLSVNYSFPGIISADTLNQLVISPARSPQEALYSYDFYRNLRIAAEKTYLTRRLHALVIRPRERFPDDFSDGRDINEFSRHEGKTIRNISINRLEVFGENIESGEISKEGTLLERLANRLHVKTNTTLIRRSLFFNQGDKIDPQKLADNERLLRSLSQIEDARIYLVEDAFQSQFVDVVVMTRDFWSKGFDLEFREPDAGVLELYDRNFLGFGRELQFNLHFDAEEEPDWLGHEGLFRAANLYGTFVDGGIRYKNAFDDKIFHISLDRSFFTPDIKYAGGASFQAQSRIQNILYPDTVYLNQPIRYHMQDYWFGRSFPLSRRFQTDYRTNIVASARLQRIVFNERPDIADNLFHRFHNKTLWLTSFAWTRQDFYKSRFVYRLGQNEDIPFGTVIQMTTGIENNQFFSRTYLSGRLAKAFLTERAGFFFTEVSMGSFYNDSDPEQSLFSIEMKWFSPLNKVGKFNMRLFSHLRYLRGENRFEDEFLTLNDKEGIRGLKSPLMSGNQKLAINLESVFFSPARVLGFRIAWYTFTDFGWIGPGRGVITKQDFYGGIGFGAKIRSELMVFPSLVLRLAAYPIIPKDASFRNIYLGSEKLNQPDLFRAQKPDILPYR